MEENWINEGAKWFKNDELCTKAWTLNEWRKDTDIRTVWIVRASLLSRKSDFTKEMDKPDVRKNLRILATFSDEAHQSCRSFKSQRGQILRDITLRSQFNVLISGTPFPLGISTNALEVLVFLGGSLEKQDPLSKWNANMRVQLKRLLADENFDILAFRMLIAPFYLRRTGDSSWSGEWLIPRSFKCPMPHLLAPYPDNDAESFALLKAGVERTNKRGFVTENEKILRADKQRLMAWTPLYATVSQGTERLEDSKKQKAAEKIILKDFRRMGKATGRLRRFIALVKHIKAKGEKFIIVADRLFLLSLAYHVSSLLGVS